MKQCFELNFADKAHRDYCEAVRKKLEDPASGDIFRDIFLTENNKIAFTLQHKNLKTFRDDPVVPWKQVKSGHVLWKEWYPEGDWIGVKKDWYSIRITKKYGGVIFYRWLEGPDKGKLEHLELGSYASIKMIYPYIITLPKGCEVVDCWNPKQIYFYV